MRSCLKSTPFQILIAILIAITLTLIPIINLNFRVNAEDGMWNFTSSLNNARYAHNAILLQNGEVLVTGGADSNFTPLATAELYDPNTSSWVMTNPMNLARVSPTATLLKNGKVLVAGGYNGSYLSSAELYDPNTGNWSFTGSMNVARDEANSALLPSGKVLVTGGYNGSYLSSAELYDPNTGTWSPTGSMHVSRVEASASSLLDGSVLVTGGYNGNYFASTEVYNPNTGTWSYTGSMNVSRVWHTQTLLSNGKVLVTGGASNGEIYNSAEIYDPSTGIWSLTGSMANGRYFHSATILQNGKVLVAGGNYFLASAEVYDPVSGTWTTTASMNVARARFTTTLLSGGQVLAVGGAGNSVIQATSELYALSNLDTTSPSLILPGTISTNATSPQGATVSYTVTATDPDNQPSELTLNCSPISGSVFPIGTSTVNCSASDPVGNTANGSFKIVVKGAGEQINDLINLVNSFNLSHGEQTSLDAKLQSALNALNINSTQTACSSLSAFINEAEAQSGKTLTQVQVNQLVSAATQIEAVLG